MSSLGNKEVMAKNLKKYIARSGKDRRELAEIWGIPYSTVSEWINGRKYPRIDRIEIMADYFGIAKSDLIEEDTGNSNYSTAAVRVPVLGYVRAGIPIEAVEEILDYEEIPKELAEQGEYFALKIKGDSMEPKISDGDVVIVRQQPTVENGEIAVVLVNGNDATVKRFYKNENGVKLISTNPTYEPFYFSVDEVKNLPIRVIGKVIELRAKF